MVISGVPMAVEGIYVDQLRQIIEQIKETPDSRRMVVSAWNVGDLPKMLMVLSCTCFNFMLLTTVVMPALSTQRCISRRSVRYCRRVININDRSGLQPLFWDFVHTLGDAHLYSNHIRTSP